MVIMGNKGSPSTCRKEQRIKELYSFQITLCHYELCDRFLRVLFSFFQEDVGFFVEPGIIHDNDTGLFQLFEQEIFEPDIHPFRIA